MKNELIIEKVNQPDSTGCGLACVAMLAGEDYATVKTAAHNVLQNWPKGPRSLYTDEVQIRALFRHFNIRFGHLREFNEWHEVANRTALVAINKNKRNNWHWVVHHFDEQGAYLLDPQSPAEKRRNLNRSRPYFFIPINLEHHA